MLVELELDLDLDDVDGLLDRSDLLTPGELTELAWRAVAMIDDRTSRGRDAFGVPFQPYDADYARRRRRAGRSRRVNLTDTGAMLGALQGGYDTNAALVFFANQSAAEVADYHVSDRPRSTQPKRDFLNIDEDGREAQELGEMAAEFIARRFL